MLPLQGAPSKDDIILNRPYSVEENGPDPEKTDRVMLKRNRLSRIFFNSKFFDYPISLKPETIINMGFSKMQDNNGLIQLTLVFRGEKGFSMHIRDNAITFNPFDMNKKNIGDIDDDDSDFNALGMDVIKKKAKSFYYRRYQGFNTMVVKI